MRRLMSVLLLINLSMAGVVSTAQPPDDCEELLDQALLETLDMDDLDEMFDYLDSLPEDELDAILDDAGFFELEEQCERGELNDAPRESVSTSATIIVADGDFGIIPLPDDFPAEYQALFDRYTHVEAPNGGPIHFFIQNEVSTEQVLYARSVLEFYLTDVAGSTFGADKAAVANHMADNGAALMLLNGIDEGRGPNINAQTLYAGEITPPGSRAYLQNDYEFRDATFEEILHLVHDYGIGVDVPSGLDGALPTFQAQIRAATTHALDNNLWGRGGVEDWLAELREEGSLTQEYLAAVVDSYYGLWGAFNEEGGGMWGIYIAKTRDDIAAQDPMGAALMPLFFGQYLTFTARIDPAFEGSFSMGFDPTQPYTHKSQYLLHATLTGDNDANLIGNAQDNRLSGNAGENRIDGRGGDDSALFVGNQADYHITRAGDELIVIDTVAGRDGVTHLLNIEKLVFADGTRSADDV